MNPLYQKTYPDSSRGLMAALWGDSLAAYVSNDPQHGSRIKTDFTDEGFRSAAAAAALLTGTTAVTYADGWVASDAVTAGGTYSVTVAGEHGVASMSNDGTTADFGVEFGKPSLTVVTPYHSTTPCRKLTMQARIDLVAVNGQALFLLTSAAATTPVAGANDAIADVGYIGFQIRENGDLAFVSKSAAAGTSDSVVVLANADWTKLDPHNVGCSVVNGKLNIVVDGKAFPSKASQIDLASIPTGNLRPVFACTTSGTTAPSMDVDNIDVFCEE